MSKTRVHSLSIHKKDFFDESNSIIYLTPYERNKPYKETSELIYNIKFKNWKFSFSIC